MRRPVLVLFTGCLGLSQPSQAKNWFSDPVGETVKGTPVVRDVVRETTGVVSHVLKEADRGADGIGQGLTSAYKFSLRTGDSIGTAFGNTGTSLWKGRPIDEFGGAALKPFEDVAHNFYDAVDEKGWPEPGNF